MKTLIFTLANRQNQVLGYDLGFLIWINWFVMDIVQQTYMSVCDGLGKLWMNFWCSKVCLGWIVRFTQNSSVLTCNVIYSWYGLWGSHLSDCFMMGSDFGLSCRLKGTGSLIWLFWLLVGFLMCFLCNSHMVVVVTHRRSLCEVFVAVGALWGESRNSPKSGLFAPIFLSDVQHG